MGYGPGESSGRHNRPWVGTTKTGDLKPRAVVTGAAGFIGSHLTETLLRRGHRVLGIDSFAAYYPGKLKRSNIAAALGRSSFELLPTSLLKLDLDEVLEPGDWVFHLAAQPGVRDSWGTDFPNYTRTNLDATQRLLDAAHRRQVARVVFASSSSVYGNAPMPMAEDGPLQPVSPYGVTKLAAEQLCQAYHHAFGLPVVPLRFFTVYGPRQRPDMAFHRFIEAVAGGRPLVIYGTGSQRRDFTYVEDVIDVLVAAAERAKPGDAMNVGGGSPATVLEAITMIERAVGRRALVEHRPAPAGDARDTEASTVRLARLGLTPRTGLAEGIERQVQWQLARGSASHQAVRSGSEAQPEPEGGPRVVMYSQDTYGLGHLRRNLAIAGRLLRREPAAKVTLLAGVPNAASWPRPPGVEIVQLPSIVKVATNQYRAAEDRHLSGLLAERAGIAARALMTAKPDIFLVDHAPVGVKGELQLAIKCVREQLPQCRMILGLRDIMDDPAVHRQGWSRLGAYMALENEYDRVLIYGSQDLYDTASNCGLSPNVRQRTAYVGYISKEMASEPRGVEIDGWSRSPGTRRPRVLVMGGGGRDAAGLFHAFMNAWPAIRSSTDGFALLVTGPLMEQGAWTGLVSRAEGLEAIRLVTSSHAMLRLVAAADVVVSMGGYNSVVEVLSAGRPLVVLPREGPSQEQSLRAKMLERTGLARCVMPDEGAAILAVRVQEALRKGPPDPATLRAMDFGGADRVVDELLALARRAALARV